MRRIVVVVVLTAACATATTRPVPPSRTTSLFDVHELGIEGLARALSEGHVTSRQLVEQYLARIDAYDQTGPNINAMITINPHALEAADALDRERISGHVRGPLHGIPLVVKDNYDTADMPTENGSPIVSGRRPDRDLSLIHI